MSAPGEILELASLSSPDIGVITNVCPVHTEFFSSIEDIASAKAELLAVLDGKATAVLNADDDWFGFMKERCGSRIVTFGLDNTADVSASDIRRESGRLVFLVTAKGETAECTLNASGIHNVSNALAAIAVGLTLGSPSETAAKLSPEQRRRECGSSSTTSTA